MAKYIKFDPNADNASEVVVNKPHRLVSSTPPKSKYVKFDPRGVKNAGLEDIPATLATPATLGNMNKEVIPEHPITSATYEDDKIFDKASSELLLSATFATPDVKTEQKGAISLATLATHTQEPLSLPPVPKPGSKAHGLLKQARADGVEISEQAGLLDLPDDYYPEAFSRNYEKVAALLRSDPSLGIPPPPSIIATPATCAEIGIVYCTDLHSARAELAKLIDANPQAVGVDFETAPNDPDKPEPGGLLPLTGHIRLMQFAIAGHKPLVIDLYGTGGVEGLKEPVSTLVGTRGIAHNAVFEMAFLAHAGMPLVLDCTMLMDQIVESKQRRSLANIVKSKTNEVLDKTLQKSGWDNPELTVEQIKYAALDAELMLDLRQDLVAKIKHNKLGRVYQINKNAQCTNVAMRLRGMHFDVDAHRVLADELQAEVDVLEAAAKQALPGVTNPNSPQQLKNWMLDTYPKELRDWPTTPKGGLSLDKSVIDSAIDKLPKDERKRALIAGVTYKSQKSLLSKIGHKFAEHAINGVIHGDFNLCGTVTGRRSSSKPNMQNIPNDPKWRGLFTAPPGLRWVIGDLGSMEMRVIAEIANEEVLREAFREGIDPHKGAMALILGCHPDDITDGQRKIAKIVNFGILFGMSARSLAKLLSTQIGIPFDDDKAQEYIDKWLSAYPAITAWRGETLRRARRYMQVSTPAGRIQRLYWNKKKKDDEDERELTQNRVWNTPVQGGAAEVLLIAEGHLMQLLDDRGLSTQGATPIATIHDEIIIEAPEHLAEAAKEALHDAMVYGMLEMFPKAPTNGKFLEVHIGSSWAEK